MNTEATHESNTAAQTTGERLRAAREVRGLSQQAVAERLCLKVSTVKDIEDDKSPAELASTFLRGYIRSYARLVGVPEEEILPMMAKQAPVRDSKVQPMQSFSLGKRRKKKDGWLMSITWLILFVVVGLTGAWWWQNHKAQQADLTQMADQTQAEEHGDASDNSIPLNFNSQQSETDADTAGTASQPTQSPSDNAQPQTSPVTPTVSAESPSTPSTAAVMPPAPAASAPVSTMPAPESAPASTATVQPGLPTAQAAVSAATPHSGLSLAFNGDCWLEVADASGKKLFSGLKHRGETLDVTGSAPYKLKIGAPNVVTVHYQGKPVDLTRFVRTNQVARFTVGE